MERRSDENLRCTFMSDFLEVRLSNMVEIFDGDYLLLEHGAVVGGQDFQVQRLTVCGRITA
jgi:hypothetical protein